MTDMCTVDAALKTGVRTLGNHSGSARLDAEILLGTVLNMSRSALLVHGTDPIGSRERQAFERLIAERAHGTPIAYLTGVREFWSLELTVTPDVLIPRPETELLVELALGLLPQNQPASALDLGTGSGAIALALASERPRMRVTGCDVCAAAIAVAAANSLKLGLSQVRWRVGSWFGAVPGERFDLIAANPPYIASDDCALANLAAEPRLALCSGPTGIEALQRVAEDAAAHLTPRGWLLLEHGSTQAELVAGMLRRQGFHHVRSHDDYSGKSRVTSGTVNSTH